MREGLQVRIRIYPATSSIEYINCTDPSSFSKHSLPFFVDNHYFILAHRSLLKIIPNEAVFFFFLIWVAVYIGKEKIEPFLMCLTMIS